MEINVNDVGLFRHPVLTCAECETEDEAQKADIFPCRCHLSHGLRNRQVMQSTLSLGLPTQSGCGESQGLNIDPHLNHSNISHHVPRTAQRQ